MSMATLTTPRTENTERRITSNWTQQLPKMVVVTASSIGLGWCVSQLWGGPQVQSSNGLSLEGRDALAERVHPLLGTSRTILNQHSCIAEIVAGSLGSTVTASPLPLALGVLSCIPTMIAADSSCERRTPPCSTIKLSEFTLEAQKFLSSSRAEHGCYRKREAQGTMIPNPAPSGCSACYERIPLKIFYAYSVESDLVIIDLNTISAKDFKDLIEEVVEEAAVYGMKTYICRFPFWHLKKMAKGKDWKDYFSKYTPPAFRSLQTDPLVSSSLEEFFNGPCPVYLRERDIYVMPQTIRDKDIYAMARDEPDGKKNF